MSEINIIKARRLLTVASEILPKLPNNNDSALTLVIKGFGILDSFLKHTMDREIVSELSAYMKSNNTISYENSTFVTMLWESTVLQDFTCKTLKLDNGSITVNKFSDPKIGSVFLCTNNSSYNGKETPSETFFASENFDFDALLALFWKKYDGKVHLEISLLSSYWDPKVSFSPMFMITDPLFGKAVDKLKEFKIRHVKYMNDDVHRTYMLVGKPGTGKSTFAIRLGTSLSGKVIRVNAEGLSNTSFRDLSFLFKHLKPEFVIVDDVDRVVGSSSPATLLTVLSELKLQCPNTALILTANSIKEIDNAMLRPGRVDEIIYFECPDAIERYELLNNYLEHFEVKLSKENIDDLVKSTEGLTAAYLKEVALRMKYFDSNTVNKAVEELVALAKDVMNDEKDDESSPEED